MNISAIVFSKDRPLQLHAYIESLIKFGSMPEDRIYILYKNSDAFDYEITKKSYSKCKWIEEVDFRADLTKIIDDIEIATDYVLWGCDDLLFYRKFNLKDCTSYLDSHSDTFTFTLRLGDNIYPPPSQKLIKHQDYRVWNWTEAGNSHWIFPWEVSGSIYRVSDVKDILCPSLSNVIDLSDVVRGDDILEKYRGVVDFNLKKFQIKIPNHVEGAFYVAGNYLEKYGIHKPLMCSFAKSKTVTITVNRVQDDFKNEYDTTDLGDLTYLNQIYKAGFRLNIFKLLNYPLSDSVHSGGKYLIFSDGKCEQTKTSYLTNVIDNLRIFKNIYLRWPIKKFRGHLKSIKQ